MFLFYQMTGDQLHKLLNVSSEHAPRKASASSLMPYSIVQLRAGDGCNEFVTSAKKRLETTLRRMDLELAFAMSFDLGFDDLKSTFGLSESGQASAESESPVNALKSSPKATRILAGRFLNSSIIYLYNGRVLDGPRAHSKIIKGDRSWYHAVILGNRLYFQLEIRNATRRRNLRFCQRTCQQRQLEEILRLRRDLPARFLRRHAGRSNLHP